MPRGLLLLGVILIGLTVSMSSGVDDDEFAEFDDVPIAGQKAQSDSRPPGHQAQDQQREEPKKRIVDSEDPQSRVSSLDSTREYIEESFDKKDEPKKKPDLKLVNAPLPRVYKWESYYVEVGFILICVLYLINFFIGSSKNSAFASEWYESCRDVLKQEFALVGGAPQLADGPKRSEDDTDVASLRKQRGLIKSTESLYTLWNSGRTGMDGLLVEINLLKRQDLFSMALNLLKSSNDTLYLRFLLNQDGYENFVFCVAHKNYAAKIARESIDINTFCSKRKPISQYGIELDRLWVMSELSDVTSFILDQKTGQFLKRHQDSVNFIHITDQFSTARADQDVSAAQKLANPKRMATFSFRFPLNQADRVEFITFSLNLLEKLRRFKMARDSKQKSEKNRQKISDILQKTALSQRQEAAQAKKEEARRLEKERIYNEDDPEKQRRWEKKEAKRELKKKKMRVKQLKVKSM